MANSDFYDQDSEEPSSKNFTSNNYTYDLSCGWDNDTYWFPEDALPKLPVLANATFAVVFVLALGIAVVANSLTIYVTYRGKHRLLYRCCLISLACSDLMIAVSSALSNFPKYLQDAHNYWVTGEFLCFFLPFMQTMSMLANSMTLSCIAVDRYLVVTQAMRTYWDPSGFACVACVVTIWISSAGVAFPMYGHYMWGTAAVLREGGLPCYLFHVCTLKTKVVKFQYFMAVFTIIFLPLLVTFIVLYCLVMRFLWMRKRPGASKPFIPPASGGGTSSGDVKAASSAAAARDSRKTRTVKVILALMVTFVCLRMPSWVYLLYVSVPKHELSGFGWLLTQNVCSALVIVNCAINPFFYCFLNQVMSTWDQLVASCRRCFGRSTTSNNVPAEEGKVSPLQPPQIMIPRGPYSVQEPSGDNTHLPRAENQNGSSTLTSTLNSSPRLNGKDTGGPRNSLTPTF